jgi:hypothetical protein
MKLDRRKFFASRGGAAAVAVMTDEAKADALERFMQAEPAGSAPDAGPAKFPTAADVEAQIETRPTRKGVGNLFASGTGNVRKLPPIDRHAGSSLVKHVGVLGFLISGALVAAYAAASEAVDVACSRACRSRGYRAATRTRPARSATASKACGRRQGAGSGLQYSVATKSGECGIEVVGNPGTTFDWIQS